MKQLIENTYTLLADSLTPVSIYLKVRDLFPNPLLLESNDFHYLENCFSYICLDPVAEFRVKDKKLFLKHTGEPEQTKTLKREELPGCLQNFIQHIKSSPGNEMNGFFGYMTYDSVKYFENLEIKTSSSDQDIPDIRYQLFRYVIAINHFKNQVTIKENRLPEEESQLADLISVIRNKPVPRYPFKASLAEQSNMTDDYYNSLVDKAKSHCQRGDVFQLVLSRSFSRNFKGDEFNVYRALRSINPSPYLFYFDYGDYKLIGSSPEMQLKTKDQTAVLNPIAGTFKRTGEDAEDKELAEKLLKDKKENSEHVMLVDLARNDLARHTKEVEVARYKEVQFYSHVLHIVSSVTGKMKSPGDVLKILSDTFPAGTLTGAPKYRAMQLIDQYEPDKRGFYGGCIGFINPEGESNHAIMIRTLLSKGNKLFYRAGAGIINESVKENELKEVDHKLAAIRNAIEKAVNIHSKIYQL